MKKIILLLSAIFLLAAGCNTSQPTTQQTQPTPSPQQQTTENPTPTPTPIQSQTIVSNNFDSTAKPGDKVGAMVVVSASFDQTKCCNLTAQFSGTVALIGRLSAPTDNPTDAGMGPQYSLNDLNSDSLKKLPYLDSDTRSVWFGVRNPEVMKNFQVKNGDTVEITINKYYYNFSPTDAWNEADVVSVKKIQ